MKGSTCLLYWKHTNQASDAYNTRAEHVDLAKVFWLKAVPQGMRKQNSHLLLLPCLWNGDGSSAHFGQLTKAC